MEFKGKKLTLRSDCRQNSLGTWTPRMVAIWTVNGVEHEHPIVFRGDLKSRAEAEAVCRDAAPGILDNPNLPEAWG